MFKRGLFILLIGGLLLAGCKGDNQGGNQPSDGGDKPATAVQRTPPPLSPRERDMPEDDPMAFEAPFSVGEYVRDTSQGQPAATRLGGLQATYSAGDQRVALTIYYFRTTEEAIAAVRNALESQSLTLVGDPPFYGDRAAYGTAEDKFGNTLAAWSQGQWFFMVNSTGDLAALNAFLDKFPY